MDNKLELKGRVNIKLTVIKLSELHMDANVNLITTACLKSDNCLQSAPMSAVRVCMGAAINTT